MNERIVQSAISGALRGPKHSRAPGQTLEFHQQLRLYDRMTSKPGGKLTHAELRGSMGDTD